MLIEHDHDGAGETLLPPPTRLTWGVLMLVVGVFAGTQMLGWHLDGTPRCAAFASGTTCVLSLGWKDAAAIQAGAAWRLLTAALLHGDAVHLALNGLALALLVPRVEGAVGAWRTGSILLVAALAGNGASLLGTPLPALGASGMVFGLIGALLVVRWRIPTAVPGDQAVLLALIVIGSVALGLLLPTVDTAAHLGGLVGGAVIAGVGSRRQPPLPRDHPFPRE